MSTIEGLIKQIGLAPTKAKNILATAEVGLPSMCRVELGFPVVSGFLSFRGSLQSMCPSVAVSPHPLHLTKILSKVPGTFEIVGLMGLMLQLSEGSKK